MPSLYQTAIPPMVQILTALSGVLDKGAAHCEAKKIDPQVLLTARLYPDMFPLTRQVQIASDSAKGAGARLAGVEVPSFPDTETTFPELTARIAKTVDFLHSVKPEQVDGAETREVVLKLGNEPTKFTAQQYLLRFAYPNFYFHVTTAYDILRHSGVDVGKRDYLGNFL